MNTFLKSDCLIIFPYSTHLYYLFPPLEEGGLATYRQAIVQNQHLAVLARVGACRQLLDNFFVNCIREKIVLAVANFLPTKRNCGINAKQIVSGLTFRH